MRCKIYQKIFLHQDTHVLWDQVRYFLICTFFRAAFEESVLPIRFLPEFLIKEFVVVHIPVCKSGYAALPRATSCAQLSVMQVFFFVWSRSENNLSPPHIVLAVRMRLYFIMAFCIVHGGAGTSQKGKIVYSPAPPVPVSSSISIFHSVGSVRIC